jgi:lipopolysaccharide/colanic/teichoic acid biosynthesis glycosyltransferase
VSSSTRAGAEPVPPTGAIVMKRATDAAIAAVALIVLAPVLAGIALLIVLDSPGPVLYRSERVGHRGRTLRMLKFRKMRPNAAGGSLTVAADERFTRLGAFLARTKLDELPQLWHVLRGEMSLVGPRPETPDHVAGHAEAYLEILRIRPGLTGYTQLAFACEGAILDARDPYTHYVRALLPQKVALDRLYATGWTLRGDLRILAATVAALVFRRPIAVDRATGRLTLRRRPPRPAPAPRPVEKA